MEGLVGREREKSLSFHAEEHKGQHDENDR
jgi:hypothetical protein